MLDEHELALHLIVDNSSTHTTEVIRAFLGAHPRIHLHFMPESVLPRPRRIAAPAAAPLREGPEERWRARQDSNLWPSAPEAEYLTRNPYF